jgi:hypothetical protein
MQLGVLSAFGASGSVMKGPVRHVALPCQMRRPSISSRPHRGIKGRYRPMRGFKVLRSADRFCRAFDEARNFLRPTSYINQSVSLARRRVIHVQRVAALRDLISVA